MVYMLNDELLPLVLLIQWCLKNNDAILNFERNIKMFAKS